MSLAEIAKMAGKTGGTIAGHAEINAQGAGPGFGTHIVDVEVDKQTGSVKILRYTVVQDVGKAIHPAYVEGQMQGGAAQGIGWALNEEYVYGDDGVLQNPGFLDYRVPVASDLPFIDTVIVEVPNPNHPYGVRGCGEVPIIAPMAAIANAIENAIGLRLCELPILAAARIEGARRRGGRKGLKPWPGSRCQATWRRTPTAYWSWNSRSPTCASCFRRWASAIRNCERTWKRVSPSRSTARSIGTPCCSRSPTIAR